MSKPRIPEREVFFQPDDRIGMVEIGYAGPDRVRLWASSRELEPVDRSDRCYLLFTADEAEALGRNLIRRAAFARELAGGVASEPEREDTARE